MNGADGAFESLALQIGRTRAINVCLGCLPGSQVVKGLCSFLLSVDVPQCTQGCSR